MLLSRIGLAITLCFILGLFLSSCNLDNILGGADGEETTETHDHIYDTFSGPTDGHWPPNPKQASNFSSVPNFSPIRVQTTVRAVQVSNILDKDIALQQALGERSTSFAIDILDSSYSDGDLAQSSYFNYATNETIDVRVTNDGKVQLTKSAASQQQPPENTEEVSKAIALAKTELLSAGNSEVNTLKGTAMLAFPKRAYIAETGNTFFPTRKLYVTFGVGNGLEPKFSALVDLSNETVESSGSIGTY